MQRVKGAYTRLSDPEDKLLKYRPMHWVLRLATFLVYFVFSILFVTDFWEDNKCHVRHTYRTEIASSVLANPFYTSTQVWRNPPPNQVDLLLNGYEYDLPRMADIGVFPVVMEDIYHDASFLPLIHVPPADAVEDDTTEAYQAIQALRKMFTEGRTVPKSIQPDFAMAASHMMLNASFDGVMGNGAMLPNFARCVNLTTGGSEDPHTFYKELAKFVDRSYYRGSCSMTGMQQRVDVRTNPKTDLAPFSSVSLYFIPHVIFWVAASFQLNYMFYNGRDAEARSACLSADTNGLLNTIAFGGAFVWNAIGAAIAVYSGLSDGMRVPTNNLLIAIFTYAAAVLVQWKWQIGHVSTTRRGAKAAVVDNAVVVYVPKFEPDRARIRKPGMPADGSSPEDPIGPAPPAQPERRLIKNAEDQASMFTSAGPYERKYDTGGGGYPQNNDQFTEIMTFESMEHAVTSPLLIVHIVTVYSSQVADTGTLQVMFLMVLGVRMICGGLFRMQGMRNLNPSIANSILEIMAVLYVCALALAGTYTAFAFSYGAATTGPVLGIILMEWAYIVFVGFIVFYEYFAAFSARYILRWALVPAFVDMLFKVIAVAFLWQAAKHLTLPNHACGMWAHLQQHVREDLRIHLSQVLDESLAAA